MVLLHYKQSLNQIRKDTKVRVFRVDHYCVPTGMEFLYPSRRRLHQTPTSVTIRQLEQLWPILSWPDQPLPVLDVGCGLGDIAAKFLAPRVPEGTKIVACDACPENLEHARQHNSVPGVIDHLLFHVEGSDVEQTVVWEERPYCKVFALLLAQEMAQNRQAIQNIYKLLAPGGEAIFTVAPKICLWQMYEEIIDDPEWKQCVQDLQRYVSPYFVPEDTVGEMKQLLTAEGFHIVHAWSGPVKVAVTFEEEMRQLMGSMSILLNRMSESLQEDFTEDADSQMLQNEIRGGNADFGERRVVPCTSTVVVGRKQ